MLPPSGGLKMTPWAPADGLLLKLVGLFLRPR
jgi:hypothetical protein